MDGEAQAYELRALTGLKEKLLACMHACMFQMCGHPGTQTNYAHNHKLRRAMYL
jgi:hypothetical protein